MSKDALADWALSRSSFYSVFNYGWLILNKCCASHAHPSDFFFFSSFSILFDVFCIKISMVQVKQFGRSINLKYLVYTWLSLKKSIILWNFFPLVTCFLTVWAADARLVQDGLMKFQGRKWKTVLITII